MKLLMIERSETKTTHETEGVRCLGPVLGGILNGNKAALGALTLLVCAGVSPLAADSGEHNHPPAVPAAIKVQAGNEVHFHGFARGVQIYTWNGASWGSAVPEATLFDDDGNQVAIHFAGPTWESNNGSKVVGAVVPPTTTVDTNSIPWVLLRAVSTEGFGVLSDTTFIQRIHTAGGKAPTAPGTAVGQVARMPYTADYFFYRKTDSGAENDHDRDGGRFYRQSNLVSDQPRVALVQDTNLVNAWGMSFSPTSPFWVNDNGRGRATLYAVTNDASGAPHVAKQGLEVSIPGGAPTGQAFNNTTNFHGDAFLFVGEDGTISGWRGALGTTAEVLKTRPTAVYKGATLASVAGEPLLVAANFSEGTIDVYDGSMNLAGQFSDPDAPADYAPFNVQEAAGVVFVTFAKQDALKHDDVPGPGHGLIDVLDLETRTIHRFATGSDAGGHLRAIDSPWGVVVAPSTFGEHADQLLVGNFGSGTIMAFDERGGFQGFLESGPERPLVVDGLWALAFGNGAKAGVPGTLYFTAGPEGETHGLLGSLEPARRHEPRNRHDDEKGRRLP